MEYLIREMQHADLPRFIELCKNHADYEKAHYDTSDKLELLKGAISADNKRLHCFVIEYRSQLIGYYSYTFDFSTWDAKTFMHLDCLYLEPAFRGRKIGERVFENLKEVAIHNNCVKVKSDLI